MTVLLADAATARQRLRSRLHSVFSRFPIGRSRSAQIGLILSLLVVFIAIASPVLTPYDPLAIDPGSRLQPPTVEHWFGTDQQGRDVFSRTIAGSRISIVSAMIIVALAVTIGVTIGIVAGYAGGWVDETLMRIADVFLAFPPLLLAMGVAAALGPSLSNAILATSLVWWPWYARVARAEALHIKHEGFVDAARTVGASNARILRTHILPVARTPIIVQISLSLGAAIVTLASLSFIGLGAQAPTPEWGTMIAEGRAYLLNQWWIVTAPGVAIFVTIMAFNILGDGVQEVLSPPEK
ncbi:MAG: ABC transporter permease [Bauldia sp.]|uniref:ABC transporter permease n=1 Tax=Bauldia sp. TaxID=2575872 RepID=UPI001DCCE4CC|nr:ABC transporter permease [Bauldia sp.]MCB1497582.1 ABC transporter permease [Bauldia sp.]